jgi:DnaJ-class molecular chaperone
MIPPAPPARPAGPPPVAAAAAPAPRPSPLPTSGAVETITEQQAAALRKLAQGLNTVDYFETLGLSQAATPGEIKKAFYRESRTYHPDRFFHLAESQEKTDISSIYKRVTEAYYVLRDDTKRKKYLADLAGTERSNKLRYTDATESELKAEARKTVEEEFGTNPKARPFFKTALAEFEKGNLPAAQSALKMGLTYEPGNVRFKEKLAEVQKKIEDARRGQAPSFMIK